MLPTTSVLNAPACYGVGVVASFEELVSTPMRDGINALCWQRHLEGDFAEVLSHVPPGNEITPLEDAWLKTLPLSTAGRIAVATLLSDLAAMRAHGLDPVLDCIRSYPRDEDTVLPVHVYSFHADSATAPADTYLCTYSGAPSSALRYQDAMRRVDIPETRAKLLSEFGGADDAQFAEYLADNCYDLHYEPKPGATPFSFGIFNLWRIAVDYPGNPVPPCIHRAPDCGPADPPRLLLIS